MDIPECLLLLLLFRYIANNTAICEYVDFGIFAKIKFALIEPTTVGSRAKLSAFVVIRVVLDLCPIETFDGLF